MGLTTHSRSLYSASFGASIAQLVEQLTLNQLVLGSSPSGGTNFFVHFPRPPQLTPLFNDKTDLSFVIVHLSFAIVRIIKIRAGSKMFQIVQILGAAAGGLVSFEVLKPD